MEKGAELKERAPPMQPKLCLLSQKPVDLTETRIDKPVSAPLFDPSFGESTAR
jgi:hypothetical protein